jgi:hypothetical protein
MDPLRMAVRRFDDWLSRVEGVQPFAEDPRIILRLQRARLPCAVRLPPRSIPAGAPALMLHFWNERMPPLSVQGADLRWALQFQRRLIYTFHAIARHLQRAASLQDIVVVGGIITHIHTGVPDGGRLILERLGFTILPYHRPAGGFGEFWENFYTWLLIWTYNPASLQSHALFGMQRNEFWMTKEQFLERFAEPVRQPVAP